MTAGFLVVATVCLLAAPAGAIIGGEADGNGHPYAGGIDARQTGGVLTPSGVLISPTVYLTAAHVTRRWDDAGLTRARVTFDPVVSDSSTWYMGTVHTNPAYDPNRPNDPGDLGVVVFDTPVPGITPASLPTEGLLDELGPQGLPATTFTAVGYGISRVLGSNGDGSRILDFTSGGTRNVAQLGFLSLAPGLLRLNERGDGEMCTGDSGAPSLLGNSDVVVAIYVGSPTGCSKHDQNEAIDQRLDTPSARAFLGQYVSLP